MSKNAAEWYLEKSSKLPKGVFECPEKDCPKPRGERRLGFTGQGMKVHYAKVHSGVGMDDAFLKKISANFKYVQAAAKVVTIDPGKTTGVSTELVDAYDSMKGGVSDADEFAVDYGTPGHEVVMGPVNGQRLIDDIKDVVGHDDQGQLNSWVTPEYAEDAGSTYVRGWFVRGRSACCDWTAAGNKHGQNALCKGYFVLNPNLTEELHQKLYGQRRSGHPEPHRNRPAYNSPVETSNDEGVRVKARSGVLYVNGQPVNLQAFIDGLRLAVRIS